MKTSEPNSEASASSVASASFYIPALDALRVIAFFLVFTEHSLETTMRNLPDTASIANWFYYGYAEFGRYGVSIFFSLSSYLITRLLLQEQDSVGEIRVGQFYLRRILRIWPLYFLIVAVNLLWGSHLSDIPIGFDGFIKFATFTANLTLAQHIAFPLSLGLLWSVCVEEQFYLIWPWIVRFARSDKAFYGVIGVMLLTGSYYRYVTGSHPNYWQAIWFHSLSHLDSFAWGAVAARLVHQGKLSVASRWAWPIAAGSMVGAFILATLWPVGGMDTNVPLEGAMVHGLVSFLCAAVVLGASFITFTGEPGWITRQGKYTYGLYCWHGFAVLAIIVNFPNSSLWFRLPVELLITYLLARLSYAFVEKPFLRLKVRHQIVPSGER